jgi:hypothetical protein
VWSIALSTLSRRLAASCSVYSSGSFMTWVLQDATDKAIVSEIGAQSDRGAMIIAGSFLETRLMQTIIMRLDPNATGDQLGKMFKGTNPLATFSAKIDVGALLQIYPAEAKDLLHRIRELRNDAAHETSPISFETQKIAAKCANLGALIMPTYVAAYAHGNRFRQLLDGKKLPRNKLAAVTDEGWETTTLTFAYDEGSQSSREIFLMAVKVILYHLEAMKRYLAGVQIVLPPPSPDIPGVTVHSPGSSPKSLA